MSFPKMVFAQMGYYYIKSSQKIFRKYFQIVEKFCNRFSGNITKVPENDV